MTQQTNKPPFIETQTFRLLLETERPERFLRPEYFRAGRAASPAMGEQNLGDWVTVDRHDVVRNGVTSENGTACDLSRMVVTTDAGVGKTTEMRWQLPASVAAARFPASFLSRHGRKTKEGPSTSTRNR